MWGSLAGKARLPLGAVNSWMGPGAFHADVQVSTARESAAVATEVSAGLLLST